MDHTLRGKARHMLITGKELVSRLTGRKTFHVERNQHRTYIYTYFATKTASTRYSPSFLGGKGDWEDSYGFETTRDSI